MSTSPSEENGSPAAIAARYFDGRSAKAHAVTLRLAGDTLVLEGDGVARAAALATLRVSEPLGSAPRLIQFPDGGHCEVRDLAGLASVLAASRHADGWVVRMQARWGWALASLVFAVAVLGAGYRWGLPALAGVLADRMPDKVLAQLSAGTLRLLDGGLLRDSALSETRQRQLHEAAQRLIRPDGTRPTYRFLFRKGAAIGANALALPDGTVIVTDELVALADHDEEILAVLAHELGHVDRRHGLRMLIQGSVIAFVVSWYLGDAGGMTAAVPTLVLQARYSREHEREADAYGAAMLEASGISRRRLATLLAKLEALHAERSASPAAGEQASQGENLVRDYLSSHPATRERIDWLERGRER